MARNTSFGPENMARTSGSDIGVGLWITAVTSNPDFLVITPVTVRACPVRCHRFLSFSRHLNACLQKHT
jgi:hypothetical protein